VDVAEAVPEDVPEANEHRQPDAAELQVISELFQVDRTGAVLRRMDEDVAVGGDRKVALAPPLNLVQFRGVADGEDFTRLPGTSADCRTAHCVDDDTQIFSKFIHRTFVANGRAIRRFRDRDGRNVAAAHRRAGE
jgi:hypothetical protein